MEARRILPHIKSMACWHSARRTGIRDGLDLRVAAIWRSRFNKTGELGREVARGLSSSDGEAQLSQLRGATTAEKAALADRAEP